MHHLPSEILSGILSYLDFSSRRDAALVCRSWYEASLDPALLKNTKFTFDTSILEDEKCFDQAYSLYDGFLCKSPNLQIVGLNENFNAKLFLELHRKGMRVLGPHVEHLSLKNSSILEKTFLGILEYCENITSLDLGGCNSLFMSGAHFLQNLPESSRIRNILRNITALELSSSRYMNDAIVCRFFELCPSIKSLSLASGNLLFSSLGMSKSNALTFLVVQQMIALHSANITHLDLSRTSIMSDALAMLATTKGLNLKSLVMQYCRELSNEGVVNLIKKQKGLIKLDISGSAELGDATVCAACSNLKELRSLKLRKCQKVTDVSIRGLHELENLRELDISECFHVGMVALRQGISGLQHLQILEMKCCNLTRFSEAFLIQKTNSDMSNDTLHFSEMNQLFKPSLLPSTLSHLEISSSQYVDDTTLQAVSMHLTNLQVLRLSWCSSITDGGLLGIEPETSAIPVEAENDSLYQLKLKAFLSSGKYSTSHGYSGLIQKPGNELAPAEISLCDEQLLSSLKARGIVRLRRLRELNLANCRKLTATSLLHVFRYANGPFKLLESLDVGMLYQAVNDDVVEAIVTGAHHLCHVSLAFASVTDAGVLQLSKHLRCLDALNLSNCDAISGRSLDYLASNCKWLKELDVSMCRGIQAPAVNKLREAMPTISRLHSRYAGGSSLIPNQSLTTH